MKARLARLFHELQRQGHTPIQQASAVALGLFIGATPLFGFHLIMAVAFGRLFRLNLLRVYIAANISNPVIAPILTLAEIQAGALLRNGRVYTLSRTPTDIWSFSQDLLIGTIVMGSALAALGFLVTWVIASRRRTDPAIATLLGTAALRYVSVGITAWQVAHGKLAGDPVYRMMLASGVLPKSGTLVDVGCGPGLLLALLATARAAHRDGIWPHGWPPPPQLDLWGLEKRPRAASIARAALGADAAIVTGDIRTIEIPTCRAALLFDVLHLLSRDDQDRVLTRLATAVEPSGVLVIREADATGGWGFHTVRAGNWLVAATRGVFRPSFHFRSADAWCAALAARGFEVVMRPAGEGTIFANVLLCARRV